MDINDAVGQLRRWCEASAGHPLDIGARRAVAFRSNSTYGEPDIRAVEVRLGCALPASYRLFMAIVGESVLFSHPKFGGGVSLYSPQDVVDMSLNFRAEQQKSSAERYCMVGVHLSMGEYMGFLVSRPGPKNFDVYCHEYLPEEYAAISDEGKTWRTFEEWVIRVVESRGDDIL